MLELPPVAPGRSIPRTIHQLFASRVLPPQLEANVRKLRALNPDWDYRLYDDRDMLDFVARHYGARMLAYYTRINRDYGASRADLFRYLLMYRLGGLYLDIKSSLENPLSTALRSDDVYLLSRWRNGRGEQYRGWGIHRELDSVGGQEFQQWHIAAAPGHPFLHAVINKVIQNIDCYEPATHAVGRLGVLRLTGPIAYTLAISPLLPLHPHRFADSQTELGFTYSIFPRPHTMPHKQIFKRHYIGLQTPVARPGGLLTYCEAVGALLHVAAARMRGFILPRVS